MAGEPNSEPGGQAHVVANSSAPPSERTGPSGKGGGAGAQSEMLVDWLAEHTHQTRAELGTAILNRRHWERLREELRLCEFLQERSSAVDFVSLRRELERIAEGSIRVPSLGNPRRTAADTLQRWSHELNGLAEPSPPPESAPT